MISGLSEANLGVPDYDTALRQHQNYITALQSCGLEVLVLDPDETFPDSTFIEDVAVLTPHCAIVTRPAAPSRAGETSAISKILPEYFPHIETIREPGTLDGGDVMQIGNHLYIGRSGRTNSDGAQQLITILEKYGMTGSVVPVTEFLHLKTGVTALTETTLIAAGECIQRPEFAGFTILPVADEEAGAANCIRINNHILMPAGFPSIKALLNERGEKTIEVDISEFAKLDGGLTCLSLRF